MCRIFVEKNDKDDPTKITGIGGHSGAIIKTLDSSYVELNTKTIYHFNPIGS